MNEVRSSYGQLIWCSECQISRSNRIQVDSENPRGISNASFDFDRINEGFCQRSVLERSKVEAVNIIPDYALISFKPYDL